MNEVLEAYALGLLEESPRVVLEEHLLTCAICTETLLRNVDYILTIRLALLDNEVPAYHENQALTPDDQGSPGSLLDP